MRYKLTERSFAEKMADKKELTKQYGKNGLKFYTKLSTYQEIDDAELSQLLYQFQLPESVKDFLVSKGILEKVEDMEEPSPVVASPPKEEPPSIAPEEPSIREEPPKKEELPKKEPEELFQLPEPKEETKIPEPSMEPEPSISIDGPSPSLVEEPPPEDTNLTPVEKTIYRKYGEEGLKVYTIAGQGKNIREIAEMTGVSLDKVVEIMDFLKAMGLIEVEETTESRFAPLIEAKEPTSLEEEIDVPIEDEIEAYQYLGSGGLEKYTVGLDLALKYGKEGRVVLEHLFDKNEKDVLDLTYQLKIPMDTIKKILKYLESKKLVKIRKLSRQEVRRKYGYDAFAIYKRFGASGVLFYRMLGGDLSTRESILLFAKLSGIKDADKIIEILKMIHSILGLTTPINKEMVKKFLEGEKI